MMKAALRLSTALLVLTLVLSSGAGVLADSPEKEKASPVSLARILPTLWFSPTESTN